MATGRRRFVRLYVPMLMVALVLLYLALTDVPSTAEMMPAVMKFETAPSANREDIAAAREVLQKRLSFYRQSDTQLIVTIEGNQVGLSLPADVEPSVVMAEASRVGQVELVDSGTQFLATNRMVQTGPQAIPDQGVYQVVLSSADFEVVEARLKGEDQPVIEFTLTPASDARLAAHTAELRGYYFCLVVDSRVVNCPILRTPLKGRRGVIELTGQATLEDARVLAMLLHSGPLPVSLTLRSN